MTAPATIHFAHEDGAACGNLKPQRVSDDTHAVTCKSCQRSFFFLKVHRPTKAPTYRTPVRGPGVPVGHMHFGHIPRDYFDDR